MQNGGWSEPEPHFLPHIANDRILMWVAFQKLARKLEVRKVSLRN